MNKEKPRWRRRLFIFLALFVVAVVVGGLFLKNYVTPTIRTEINTQLLTVGDENYSVALAGDKKIVKFGRLPFGIYPGGVAFDDADEAAEYLEEIGKVESGWKVYVLSGDFELDTILAGERRFTNKSLLVIKEARERIEIGYETFDQTPKSGWRLLADEKKHAEAATLIEEFLTNGDELTPSQIRNLNFHAGQMHAFADNYVSAIQRFRLTLVATEPEDSPIRWNAYVNATIAFLENDKDTLASCRNEISKGPKFGDVVPNLSVVDSLISHLGKSYSEAYESHRGMQEER